MKSSEKSRRRGSCNGNGKKEKRNGKRYLKVEAVWLTLFFYFLFSFLFLMELKNRNTGNRRGRKKGWKKEKRKRYVGCWICFWRMEKIQKRKKKKEEGNGSGHIGCWKKRKKRVKEKEGKSVSNVAGYIYFLYSVLLITHFEEKTQKKSLIRLFFSNFSGTARSYAAHKKCDFLLVAAPAEAALSVALVPAVFPPSAAWQMDR